MRRRVGAAALGVLVLLSAAVRSRHGTFQGVPLVYHKGPPPEDSTVHCIGETFFGSPSLSTATASWLYRSCQFRNLCLDLATNEVFLFPSPHEQALAKLLAREPLVTVSSVAGGEQKVALGAVDPPKTNKNQPYDDDDDDKVLQLAWFPTVIVNNDRSRYQGYYQLPDSHILVPFQESLPVTPESLIRKDLLSIFALLFSFGLENKELLLTRPGKTRCNDKECTALLQQQLGIHSTTSAGGKGLVCAKYGAAGLGMLMTGTAPQRDADGTWIYTHTVGRDATLRAFEEFLKQRNER